MERDGDGYRSSDAAENEHSPEGRYSAATGSSAAARASCARPGVCRSTLINDRRRRARRQANIKSGSRFRILVITSDFPLRRVDLSVSALLISDDDAALYDCDLNLPIAILNRDLRIGRKINVAERP
jgi:hypothetical protein